jgi:hypothetical protein
MAEQAERKLNRLGRLLPEGLLVDSAWLCAQGYSSSLRSQYVSRGWLSQPARQVYRRGGGKLTWQQAVISLQTLLGHRLVVGGRSALELHGYAHFLSHETRAVHLHGPKRPPAWLKRLPVDAPFLYRHSEPLLPLADFPHSLEFAATANPRTTLPDDLDVVPYGPSDWPLVVSRPERALLELLDELPQQESFDQVDALFEGLTNVRPRLLSKLLARCRNIKVKRLFFYFAGRHKHAWLSRIDRSAVDLGKGKRMLVRGGILDPAYQITVPKDLHGVS